MSDRKINALIFDMDGVLWKENAEIINLKNLFGRLTEHNIRFSFATNNGTRTPADYQEKFASFDVQVSSDSIVTSGTNLAFILSQKFPQGGPLFIVGEIAFHQILEEKGFFHHQEDVLCVAAGMDRSMNYEHLSQASMLIQQGCEFYFTNLDPTFPTPVGNKAGAGALLAYLEAASQKSAIVCGKPEPYMLNYCMKVMQSTPTETLMIGDRLETDIMGGINADCATALVLSGISATDDITRTNIIPDLIAGNVAELIDSLISKNWMIND